MRYASKAFYQISMKYCTYSRVVIISLIRTWNLEIGFKHKHCMPVRNFFHAPIETKSSETKIFFENVKVGKEILTGISCA